MPYRSDLEAAHERIADLERSVEVLQKERDAIATARDVSLEQRGEAVTALRRARARTVGRGFARALLLVASLAILALTVAVIVHQSMACAALPPPPLEVVDFCRIRFCDDAGCAGGNSCPETCLVGITQPSGEEVLYGKLRDVQLAVAAARALGCPLESERSKTP